MADSDQARETAKRMAESAARFLDRLTPQQRAVAVINFSDAEERTNWHYIPRPRRGLAIKEMDESQRQLALDLVATGLSAATQKRTRTIMDLETILGEMEGPGGIHARDPELYFVSVFGEVGEDEPWGWRFEGHHVSLNNTIVAGCLASAAPNFLGANPAEVRHGEHSGLRALKAEEEVARGLIFDLDEEQERIAIVSNQAPDDIITRNEPFIREVPEPPGLAGAAMTPSQQQTLRELVAVYVQRLPEVVAEVETARLVSADMARVHFAWAGEKERGKAHYYRLQGPTFLAEYDNTQNEANHIHAVWRDLTRDFGEDLLKAHYQNGHR